jgi:hypothetical protein
MTEVVLATSVLAFIFGYLAMNIDAGQGESLNMTAALIQYSNLFLCYGSILVTTYLGLQTFNYSGFTFIPGRGALLAGFVNVYSLMILGVFFLVTWDLYLQIFKEEEDVGG